MKKLHVSTAFQSALDFFKENYEYLLPFSLMVFLMILPTLFIDIRFFGILFLLMIPLIYSIPYFTDVKMNTGEATFSTFFQFYKHCGKFILSIFITGIIYNLILIPPMMNLLKNMDWVSMETTTPSQMMFQIQGQLSTISGSSILWMRISNLIAILIGPLLLFFPFFATFQKGGIFEALRKSFVAGGKNYLQIILVNLLSGALLFLGALACGAGLLFTVPLIFLLLYFAYKEVEF